MTSPPCSRRNRGRARAHRFERSVDRVREEAVHGREGAPALAPECFCTADFNQKMIGRECPDAFGRTRKLDAPGIDSGYRSHVVYATVRANRRLRPDTRQDVVFALDGRDGWGKPLLGTPGLVDVDLEDRSTIGKSASGPKSWATFAEAHKQIVD